MLEEKRALLEQAFGQSFDDEQVKAFSEFVKVCTEGGYEDEEEGESSGGKGADLALVFGAEPKAGKK